MHDRGSFGFSCEVKNETLSLDLNVLSIFLLFSSMSACFLIFSYISISIFHKNNIIVSKYNLLLSNTWQFKALNGILNYLSIFFFFLIFITLPHIYFAHLPHLLIILYCSPTLSYLNCVNRQTAVALWAHYGQTSWSVTLEIFSLTRGQCFSCTNFRFHSNVRETEAIN